MIQTLKIKKIATFDETGIELENLKKVNFIYGANGCGKTTLTKIANNPIDPQYKNCSVIWKNGIPIKTLVYNKDFRDKNFGNGNIVGVFTLGQATKDELEDIRKMQIELADIKDQGLKKKGALEKQLSDKQALEDEFKEIVWLEVYKKYENDFKDAFVGVMKKDSFKARLLEEFQNSKSPVNSYADLVEKSKTVFGKVPVSLPMISTINFDQVHEIEKHPIWTKKIIGKSDVEISKLIQKLNLNDWVNEGRTYLQDDKTCPFCQQQTITDSFRKQLENYFDEAFLDDTKTVKNFSDEYNLITSNLINVLQTIEANEKINTETKLDIEKLSAYLKTFFSQVVSNKETINNKIKEPSRSFNLISAKEQLDNIRQLITDANSKITEHNKIVANFSSEKINLIKFIWKYLTDEHSAKITAFVKKLDGLQKGADVIQKHHQELQTKYTTLDKQIKTANKNVTSVQPSVDEINRTLKSFGFLNFEIVPSKTEKNQYQIHREDGTFAEATLSEGEITFITFLYFLQLAKGSTLQETITEERVLIVDDPISSLDSNVLFVVSSLLKEIIKEIKKGQGIIKQIILLTHNVYFHKEVSFVDGRTPENGDTFFWVLRRNKNVSAIQPYGMKNPIHNSYELLWNELKNRRDLSNVAIQNTMRRIIENYFKILGKYGDDDLINHFDNHQEQQICRSLICWINDGSHSIPDDLFVEHHDATGDKYFEVFQKIFTQMGHPEHYNMMMRAN